eukprot:TRINITY_DN12003_c0_g1_i1.p2 TRINITY_DN12003_c0_g1~~TRINITY_DN12003_c0_g1_i1.p2  ORF type:complete len:147 (-),score=20.00 TRINITY_DN12003_c0_g1_i1:363-803(-)
MFYPLSYVRLIAVCVGSATTSAIVARQHNTLITPSTIPATAPPLSESDDSSDSDVPASSTVILPLLSTVTWALVQTLVGSKTGSLRAQVQPASTWHWDEQPSPDKLLPSSHFSSPSTYPSPQPLRFGDAKLVHQYQPFDDRPTPIW